MNPTTNKAEIIIKNLHTLGVKPDATAAYLELVKLGLANSKPDKNPSNANLPTS